MILWLTDQQAQQIARHALETAPQEACGVIGGIDGRALRIIPIPNTASDPQHHYTLDHAAFVKAIFSLEREGLSLIGFYHSHPGGDPIPSQTDIREANYPDTAYLIIGLRNQRPTLAAWRLNYGQVERIELHIGDEPPDPETHQPLSRAQVIAILITALLAFAVMIAISFALLPPAPELIP